MEHKITTLLMADYADKILRRKKDHKKVLRQLLSDLGIPGALVLEKNKNRNDFTAGIKGLTATVNGKFSGNFYVTGSNRREATLYLLERLLCPTGDSKAIHSDSTVAYEIQDHRNQREVIAVPLAQKLSLVSDYTHQKFEKPRKPNPLKLKSRKNKNAFD